MIQKMLVFSGCLCGVLLMSFSAVAQPSQNMHINNNTSCDINYKVTFTAADELCVASYSLVGSLAPGNSTNVIGSINTYVWMVQIEDADSGESGVIHHPDCGSTTDFLNNCAGGTTTLTWVANDQTDVDP